MIDKLRRNPQLLASLLVGAILLVIISTGLKNSSVSEVPAEEIKEIILKTPHAKSIEDLKISASPSFDFTLSFADETVKLKPISILSHGQNYIITARYKDELGQTLSVKTDFTYKVPGKPGLALDKDSLSGEGFDIYPKSQFIYIVNVTSPGISEDSAKNMAAKILSGFGINKENVEFEVVLTRNAKGEGANL
ncbi:hypothetical protein KC960_04320 [Candidatus Saccharibacteria bacterium]|nr:hypothetical protein [Candidatus Saccharibacteria bacterium]